MGLGSRILMSLRFFASLIAKSTMCTAVLQKDVLTVLRFSIYLLILIYSFCNIAVLIVHNNFSVFFPNAKTSRRRAMFSVTVFTSQTSVGWRHLQRVPDTDSC